MQTTLYKITFADGRVFKVFCANKAQKERFLKTTQETEASIYIEILENGIHNIKQWEDIISKEI